MMPITTGPARSNTLPLARSLYFDLKFVPCGLICKAYMSTSQQYDSVIKQCKDIFLKKMHDYGTAWRVLRGSSLTDQIFIKAQRIRSIEQKGSQKVVEDISSEYIGIINYCVISLIQHTLKDDARMELPAEEVSVLFDKHIKETKDLMENKNHDYGEAWRDMRVSSLTD